MKQDFIFVLRYWNKHKKLHKRYEKLAGQYKQWMDKVVDKWWYIATDDKEFCQMLINRSFMRVLIDEDIKVYDKLGDTIFSLRAFGAMTSDLKLFMGGEIVDSVKAMMSLPNTDEFPIWLPDPMFIQAMRAKRR